MPEVTLDMEIRADAQRVWQAVIDIERYPESMDSVRWAKILEWEAETRRRCKWSVNLKGSILEWEEWEDLDHEALRVDFKQLRGDMEVFEGAWVVTPQDDATTRAELTVSFEIG